jgi:hypothetical protein
MAYQGIGTGTTPNDNTGDSLLIGAVKVNSNFQEIYNALGDGNSINFNQNTEIIAGNGLTGGGDLSANRTLNVGAGTGIDVAADTVAVDSTVVRTSRTITAGNGLTGGGDLSANRTLNVGAGTGIDVAANSVAVDSTVVRTSGNQTIGGTKTFSSSISGNLSGTATNSTNVNLAARNSSSDTHYVVFGTSTSGNQRLYTDTGLTYRPSTNTLSGTFNGSLNGTATNCSRSVVAGNGLTGGGALSANRTLNVGQGDGISVAANSVAVDSTVVRTSRTITAGNGLTGGGDLSANRTLNVGAGTGIDVAADTISINSSYRFPSGTRMLFQQTSAPTGWTKDTTSVDNRALRVVSGTAGSGGTTPFTDVFASRTVILPRHSHGIIEPGGGKGHSHGITDPGHVHSGVINDSGRTADGPGNPDDADYLRNTASATTGISINSSTTGIIIKNAGTAGASMDFAVQYIDVIIAQRN